MAVMLYMMLRSFMCVVLGVFMMAVCQVCMMRRFVMITFCMVLVRFFVMVRSFLVMMCCLLVMIVFHGIYFLGLILTKCKLPLCESKKINVK